jgi:hypothetical protein
MQKIHHMVNPTVLLEFRDGVIYDLPSGGVTMPHREPTIRSRELGEGLRGP